MNLTRWPSAPVIIIPPLWMKTGLSSPSILISVWIGNSLRWYIDEPKNVTCF